jgi:hypothetical protein
MPVKKKISPIVAKLAMAPTRPANAINRQSRCDAKFPDPRNMACAGLVDQWPKVAAVSAIVDDQFSLPVKFRDK